MNHSELSEQYSALEHSVSEVNDSNTEDTVDKRKKLLVSRFLTQGLVGIFAISLLLSFLSYTYLQYKELNQLGQHIHQEIGVAAKNISSKNSLDNKKAINLLAVLARNRVVSIQGLKLFDASGSLLLSNGTQDTIDNSFQANSLNVLEPYRVLSPSALSWQVLSRVLFGDYSPALVASLVPLQKKRYVVVASVDNSINFSANRTFVILLFLAILILSSLVFAFLYPTFLFGIKTIDEQEERLSQQISRLSNLLIINKSMQRSIRSASARAVELNEQFLRRTGADLHDGPAQMIGFSVMRLNQAIEKDESNLISPEFHAIKQALEESLEEIRGISSGLVLPELASLTLEQCMNKVVLLHTSAHKTNVEEVYHDVDHDIPLPIKICAYRLVQEGLNNANRHGKAEECRLTVNVKNNVLQLVLKDNGSGFRTSQLTNNGKHLGLMGLRDRIESLGGKLSVSSELGTGTSLKLIINLDQDI